MSKKIPISVLILLHDNAGNVLLFNRLNPDGFWQSITGILNTPNEPPFQAALREVAEETGFRLHPNQLRDWHRSVEYEIYPHWFSAAIPAGSIPTLSEHSAYAWLPAQDAANKVFSPSNRDIILEWLAQFEAA